MIPSSHQPHEGNDSATTSASTPNAAQPKQARIRLDRRALLRAGASASPVLLTLASNPVSAANGCVVASSFVSVATFKSRNPSISKINCASRRVEDWRLACAQSAQLAAVNPLVRATLGNTTSSYNMHTLRQVLTAGSSVATSGELGVLQHIVALHLSLNHGFMQASSGNVSPAYLASMWSNYKQNGNRFVQSTSGINWDSGQLIAWLRYQLNYSVSL